MSTTAKRAKQQSREAAVFSASEPYFGAAADELREVFHGAHIDRLGPDAGAMSALDVPISKVAEVCRDGRVGFVRHLMDERASISASEVRENPGILADVAITLVEDARLERVAVQAWGSGVTGGTIRHLVVDALEASGTTAARAGEEHILGICVTAKAAVVGLTKRVDALCDWPGGRLSLAGGTTQISRAEFKLEELFKLFPVPSARGRLALDLGASPGGWTRVLRSWGFEVWAVDPAPLDPRVMADDRVVFYQTTAGRFLDGPTPRFHLVVNDMRMIPELSCRVMLDAAKHLVPGGHGVVTLKISPKGALPVVRRALRIFTRAYDVVFLRQLFHNRNEITLVGRRPQ